MGETDKKISEEKPKTTDGSFFESQKTDHLTRRGKWKKVRVHPVESFEAAESQNFGAQFFNSLYTGSTERPVESIQEQTPETVLKLTTQSIDFDNDMTTTESSDSINFDMTTKSMDTTTTQVPLEDFSFEEKHDQQYEKEESATRRIDDELTNVEDLETQPSLFSEVRKQLSDLFAIEEDDETLTAATANISALPKPRHEYTNIQRVRTEAPTTTTPAIAATTTDIAPIKDDNKTKKFHKDLMDSVVYATSTSTKVTSETEICYRGRCIKSDDLPPNHKLH